MNLVDYLTPNSVATSWTIMILLGLFGLWVSIFMYWILEVAKARRHLKAAEDVSHLSEALQQNVSNPGSESPTDVFKVYCQTAGLPYNSTLGQHLSTIFCAGWDGSRLDVGQLLHNTNARILRYFGLLRSIQALFIIVGLLGTLFGLAESLDHLSRLDLNTLVSSQSTSNLGLKAFLEPLRSAFAPSILGILLTVLCVVILSIYSHWKVQKLRLWIEQATLNIWVPKLFPSASHRFLEGVKLAQEHIAPLAKYSKQIQKSTEAFIKTLAEAEHPLAAILNTAESLNKFATTFEAAAGQLTSFQVDLTTLYRQMVDESDAFHSKVDKTLDGMKSSHEAFVEDTKQQAAYVRSVQGTVKLFEKGYLDERKALDAELQSLIRETKKTYGAISGHTTAEAGKSNEVLNEIRAIAGSISEAQSKLADNLDKVSGIPQDLAERLTKAADNVDNAVGGLNLPQPRVADPYPQAFTEIRDKGNAVSDGIQTTLREQAAILANLTSAVTKLNTLLDSKPSPNFVTAAAADIREQRNDQVQRPATTPVKDATPKNPYDRAPVDARPISDPHVHRIPADAPKTLESRVNRVPDASHKRVVETESWLGRAWEKIWRTNGRR